MRLSRSAFGDAKIYDVRLNFLFGFLVIFTFECVCKWPSFYHTRWRNPVKCLSQGHNKRTCRLFLHTILYAERQAGSCEYQFSEVFGMTRPGVEPRTYRSLALALEPLHH